MSISGIPAASSYHAPSAVQTAGPPAAVQGTGSLAAPARHGKQESDGDNDGTTAPSLPAGGPAGGLLNALA